MSLPHDTSSALHVASRKGDVDTIKSLLESGVDPDLRDGRKQTALHFASDKGYVEVVECLLAAGANPTLKDNVRYSSDLCGGTALQMASKKGYVKIVKLLLEAASQLDKEVALYLASESGHLETVDCLLAGGAKADFKDRLKQTALHKACERGHVDVAKSLLALGPELQSKERALYLASKNNQSEVVEIVLAADLENKMDKRSALSFACREGYAKVVECLMDAKADPNLLNEAGLTALHVASQSGHVDIVKTLLMNGAEVDLQDREQYTALMMAAERGDLKIVSVLADSQANLEIANKWPGDTALLLATKKGHVDVVSKLITCGAKGNTADKIGRTALQVALELRNLMIASEVIKAMDPSDIIKKLDVLSLFMSGAEKGYPDIISKLLECGVDVDMVDKRGDTALKKAAAKGHLQIVCKLIDCGAKVEHTDKRHRTALVDASENGHFDVAVKLIDAGASIDTTKKYGETLLLNAAKAGHVEIISRLIDAGVKINATDKSNRTALMEAAERGDLGVVSRLLESGADMDKVVAGQTALMMAAEKGDLAIVDKLVDSGADLNIPDSVAGQTALMTAAKKGDLAIVGKLVDSGADLNIPDSVAGQTAVMMAAEKGDLAIVDKLVDSGADLNIPDSVAGQTALMMAAKEGHLAIVGKLVDSGADLNISNSYKRTALMEAAERGHLKVVSKLLESGANVNELYQGTLLLDAARAGRVEIISRLIDAGAKINATDRSNRTALMEAAERGYLRIVSRLLESGADMDKAPLFMRCEESWERGFVHDLRVVAGQTALMMAAKRGHLDIVGKLVDSGADLNIPDSSGCSVLMWAARTGALKVISILIDSGVNLNIDMTDEDGDTALMLAIYGLTSESEGKDCKYKYLEIIDKLINAGASVKNSKGLSPLMYAAASGDSQFVSKLIVAGANVNMTNEGHESALFIAARNGHLDTVCKLIDSGACNLDITTVSDTTALMEAAKHGSLEIVNQLISAKASLDITDKNEQTAVMAAAESGHLEIVKKFIKSGARLDTVDKNRETAADIAQRKKHTEVYQLLQNAITDEYVQAKAISHTDLEFEGRIGDGATAQVYKGLWKSTGKKVAIKKVFGRMDTKEVKILTQLNHPNIIAFFGVVIDKYAEYFIVTELAEEGSLYDVIHKKHNMPKSDRSLQWATEIAEGMKYLHQHDILHRDLKSQNVLLTGSWNIKLCDFGAAEHFDHTTLMTKTGTCRWIAPEVLNHNPVSLSSDVYSYGMLLFEILTREIPFAGISDTDAMKRIQRGEVPPIPDTCEQYLARLMKRCWKTNPRARPKFEKILHILKTKVCEEEPKQSVSIVSVTKLNKTNLLKLEAALNEGDVSNQWYQLGMELKLGFKVLLDIGKLADREVTACLLFVLLKWLMNKDPLPTLECLASALSSPSVGKSRLADSLLKNKDKYNC